MGGKGGRENRQDPAAALPPRPGDSRVAWQAPAYGEPCQQAPDSDQVERVVLTLEAIHGSAGLGNRADAIEELVWICLTRQTHRQNSLRSWQQIVSCGGPAALLDLPEQELVLMLADGGFARQKARWIKAALAAIKERFGELSLAATTTWHDQQLEAFLVSLPGVALKSARCVMMYSLGRQVLPVDVHLRRLSERLGWVAPGCNESRIHQELSTLVAPHQRYSLHVNAIWHGRQCCRALAPRCGDCLISADCRSAATRLALW